LRGVTRDIVLELARAAGIAVEERFLSREELLAADEVFITSTTLEVMPIARIDGQPVGEGRPGPVARRFGTRFGRASRRRRASGLHGPAGGPSG